MNTLREKRTLGSTNIAIPPIVFGSSALGNLYRATSYEHKRSIVSEWFRTVEKPVAIDSAGKYGAGLALETLGRVLRELGVGANEVVVSNKLGWKRVPLRGAEPTFEPGVWKGLSNDAEQAISHRGILECWEQGCELLGASYQPALVSVHDPDEFLAAAENGDERRRRLDMILEAYRALGELKADGAVGGVGVGAKDWRVIQEISRHVHLDWVMLACSLTVHTHPVELLELIGSLNREGIGVVNSAVFNSGFLIGGEYYDYRLPDPVEDAPLFHWREEFLQLCGQFGVRPAEVCVEFGLSAPGVSAVALNTGNPAHVAANVSSVTTKAPTAFWEKMHERGLIDAGYRWV